MSSCLWVSVTLWPVDVGDKTARLLSAHRVNPVRTDRFGSAISARLVIVLQNEEDAMWLRNCWQVIAFTDEIGQKPRLDIFLHASIS